VTIAGFLGLSLLSAIFLISGFVFLQMNLYQVRTWTRTSAVVIDHRKGFDEDATVYNEVVKFNLNGEDVIANTNFQSSIPKAIGKTIGILYDPEDPTTFTPYSFFSLYAAPYSFIAIGVLPIGLMIYTIIAGD
jgi:hypothetical protein